MMKHLWILGCFLLYGCGSIPTGLEPVRNFQAERYMGRWYEIKRLNHPYEGGLTNVYADYRQIPDGTIEMTSHGFGVRENRWYSAKYQATFIGSKDIAGLKLSFGGSSARDDYNVLFIDPAYRYAIVTCDDRDGLWILSREPVLDKSILDSLVAKAKTWDFPTEQLMAVEQKSRGR
jgi:apolipoprotein D and lipocalin family protein